MTDIGNMQIHQLKDEMEKGNITSREIVMEYFSRIAKLDSAKDGLNSVLEINPDALFLADELDSERRSCKVRGSLHGIPILVKDNIDTADRMHTSAGSFSLADNFALKDAYIVKKLRDAGAIILGKTNMTEFANYMTNNMPSGYSSRGGQVQSPFCKTGNPSGSSSGSAVAAAAKFCAAAIGTETCGSILSPSWNNGIVGLKPTIGSVSRSGIIPISHTLDTAGPMARNVRDAAALIEVITGRDEDDPSTLTCRQKGNRSFADMKDIRIGINRTNEAMLNSEVKALNEELLYRIRKAGAVVIDDVNIGNFEGVKSIMKYEFKTCINSYLSKLPSYMKIRTLKDIIDFNKKDPVVMLKYGQTILEDVQDNVPDNYMHREYYEALLEREKAIVLLNEAFDKHDLDIIFFCSPSTIAPLAGFPALTLPIGKLSSNMPVGSYWVSRRYDETTLLNAAYEIEKHLDKIEPDL